MTRPRPRHAAASTPPLGPPGPSDVLFLALTACTLLVAALVIGGLAAFPFAP